MTKKLKSLIILSFPVLAFFGCKGPVEVYRFGLIAVSDPIVEENVIRVHIINDTKRSLCYFNDSLSFGPGLVEGNTNATHLSESPIFYSLHELEFSSGRQGGGVRKLKGGEDEILIKISYGEPSKGDDLIFSIFDCDGSGINGYRTFIYTARL